jgi:O-antigen/teichoic acid export membrane protein
MLSYILKKFPRLNNLKEKLAESPIAYRLARGAFWSLIGGVGSRALTLVSSIVVARLLGKEGYGEVGMVQSTIGLFGVFAGFGLGSTSTKYLAEYRTTDPEKAGRILNLTLVIALISGGIMAIICLAISPWLAETTLNRADLASLLAAGSLLLFISTLGGVQSAALAGFESFRAIARISIMQGAAAPLVAIPCVWFYGVQGAIASFTINAAIGLILFTIALRSECQKFRVPQRFDASFWSERFALWKFALPSMVSNFLFIPVTWSTNAILVNQPGGYGELGLFNAANQWRLIIVFLPTLMMSSLFPVLSELHGRDDKIHFNRIISLNYHTIWVVALPLTVLTIIIGEDLISLFGEQFTSAGEIISILMIACFLSVINTTVGYVLASSERMWIGTAMNLGWAFTLIVTSIYLIPQLGAKGLAWSYLIAYLFHSVWQLGYIEAKVASSSILNHWKLMLFSVFLIFISVMIEKGNYILIHKIMVLLFALLPLVNYLKKYTYLK